MVYVVDDYLEDNEMTSQLQQTEGHLDGGVFYRSWRGQSPIKAVILLAHGLGEHCGRYQAFADYFCQHGVAVVALDHVGHGASPGRRVHITSFDDFLGPLEALRDLVDQWYPQLPCFLVGHSMGGLIAARFLLDHQHRFAGAALSAAALQVPEMPSRFSLLLIRFFSWCMPTMGALQLDASQVSRDPMVVERYLADPLVHNGKASARLVAQLFNAMQKVEGECGQITLPILLLHGDADKMTPYRGSKAFHQGAGSLDKTLKIYPGLFHEIFNEPEQLEVMGDLRAWLEDRLDGARDS